MDPMNKAFRLFNPPFKCKLLERLLSKRTKQSLVNRPNQLFPYLTLGFIQVCWQAEESMVHSVCSLVGIQPLDVPLC